MSFGIEKKKLEALLARSYAISPVNSESIEMMNSILDDYIQIVKKLNAKTPNIFANIYRYGLAELKGHKLLAYELPDKENLANYKNNLEDSIAGSLSYINDFLHS